MDYPSNFNKSAEHSVGPIVGAVIIVLILVLGGLYFWGERLNESQESLTAEQIEQTPDQTLAELKAQSESDELLDIEADAAATDLGNLDTELKNIETELNY